jgi:hypothetical protein
VPPSIDWRRFVATAAGDDANWMVPTERAEWRALLPLLSERHLQCLLRTPSIAAAAPLYSQTLSRAKNFVTSRGCKVGDIYVAHDGKSVLVTATVSASRRKMTHTVVLLFPPPATEPVDTYGSSSHPYGRYRLRDVVIDRYCAMCLFGTSGNCTHIAALLLRIAQLLGMVDVEDRPRDRDVAQHLFLGSRNEGALDAAEKSE